MRRIPYLFCLMLLMAPAAAKAQSFEVYGSGGPVINDPGSSFAVGAGIGAGSRLTILFNLERTHVPTRTRFDQNVYSASRGGTILLGTAEVRFAFLGRGRLGPFALAGIAAGVSKPNVNEIFPTPITNDVRAIFFGGGIDVPINTALSVFADARLTGGLEGYDGMIAIAPVRAGMTWRF